MPYKRSGEISASTYHVAFDGNVTVCCVHNGMRGAALRSDFVFTLLEISVPIGAFCIFLMEWQLAVRLD